MSERRLTLPSKRLVLAVGIAGLGLGILLTIGGYKGAFGSNVQNLLTQSTVAVPVEATPAPASDGTPLPTVVSVGEAEGNPKHMLGGNFFNLKCGKQLFGTFFVARKDLGNGYSSLYLFPLSNNITFNRIREDEHDVTDQMFANGRQIALVTIHEPADGVEIWGVHGCEVLILP